MMHSRPGHSHMIACKIAGIWCKTAGCGDDPWNADNMFRFLLYANKQLKAGTYAQRFVMAINWYLPKAEITTDPKQFTKLSFIESQVDSMLR